MVWKNGELEFFSLEISAPLDSELAGTKKITTGGIMSFPLFLEEIFKQKQEQMI